MYALVCLTIKCLPKSVVHILRVSERHNRGIPVVFCSEAIITHVHYFSNTRPHAEFQGKLSKTLGGCYF